MVLACNVVQHIPSSVHTVKKLFHPNSVLLQSFGLPRFFFFLRQPSCPFFLRWLVCIIHLRQLLVDPPPWTFATTPNRTHLRQSFSSCSLLFLELYFLCLKAFKKACKSTPTLFSDWLLFSHASFLHIHVVLLLNDPQRFITSGFVNFSFTIHFTPYFSNTSSSLSLHDSFHWSYISVCARRFHLLHSSPNLHTSLVR